MNDLLHLLLAVAGLIAATAVGVMCAVCLVVWLAGMSEKEPSEAWRHADKS